MIGPMHVPNFFKRISKSWNLQSVQFKQYGRPKKNSTSDEITSSSCPELCVYTSSDDGLSS